MSAVNNNMILPFIYQKAVSEKLDDLVDSFGKYTEQVRSLAPKESSSTSNAWAQAAAAMARPAPAPFIDLSTKTTHITHVTKIEAAKTEAEEEKAKKKKQEENNFWFYVIVAVTGIAGGLFGAYQYGKASGEAKIAKTCKENLSGLRQYYQKTKEEAERNAQNRMQLDHQRTLEIHMTNLDAAILAGEVVISQKADDAKRKLKITIGFIATAALAVFGAVVNSVPLIVLSGVSATVLTGYLLVKVGFGDATDELVAKKAKRVKDAFQALRNDIVKYKGFEDKNLPAPGYYYAAAPAPQPYVAPLNPNYNPFVQALAPSGPGSYNMNFYASPEDVNAVLAGYPMNMPVSGTPPANSSAPPIDF